LASFNSARINKGSMSTMNFPDRIRRLEPYSDRFNAFRMRGHDCDVLFASYPAGTSVEPHSHDTENWGVVTRGELILEVAGRIQRFAPGDWYHVPAHALHSARFERDTEQIEFWFAQAPPPA
jgi:quercetin dioxygenase-like cupin family protein